MADATFNSSFQLLDWTAIPDTVTDVPGVDSGTLDLGDGTIKGKLLITVVHTDANAASTNFVTVLVQVRAGSADENWFTIASQQAGGGTAVAEALDAESASAQPNIKVAATTDWDTGLNERLFLLDNTLVDSEMVTITGWSDADYYIAADNLANTHAATTSILYDGVAEIPVPIEDVRYVKVICANSDDDANYAFRVDFIATTDIE